MLKIAFILFQLKCQFYKYHIAENLQQCYVQKGTVQVFTSVQTDTNSMDTNEHPTIVLGRIPHFKTRPPTPESGETIFITPD